MAFTLPEGGIRPSKVGEFVGNWNPDTKRFPPVTQFEHEQVHPDFSEVRRGRPRPAGGRTSAEMADDGWIGLYLIRERRVPFGATEVPAPEWMTEPVA